jgi:hypothetical protein
VCDHPASEGSTAPPTRTSASPLGIQPVLRGAIRDRDPREAGQTVGQRRFLELDLRKAARQEGGVGLHVEVPVSAEVERIDLRLAGLSRTDGLVDHRPDGVVLLDPREVMLAAARNRDLTFAQRTGLGTAFIPRPTELGAGQTQDMTGRRRLRPRL